MPAEGLMFLDETSATTEMIRRRGRYAMGKRLAMAAPHGCWKTTTLVVAFRLGGMTAPTVIDGAMNADPFMAYVKQQLVPTLREGDVVVMDYLASHMKSGVEEAIVGAGARVEYLPPYSPDFNPPHHAISISATRVARTSPMLAVSWGANYQQAAGSIGR